MAAIAAGLALGGFVPVAGTFAVFMTRAFDHIRVQICQNNLHVVMVGSHGGVSNALDGASAHALEDLAYMRALPNMTVLFPVDAPQTKLALAAAITADGPVYLRLYREPTPVITSASDTFEIGAAQVLKQGRQVSLVSTGPQVATCLDAAKQLAALGIEAEVVSVPTLAPFDWKTIVASAKHTGKVVTIEDHNIHGGLGSAVAEALGEHHPTPLKRIGVTQFGESGKYADLIGKLGLDARSIVTMAQSFVAGER
jgi:transketolase